MHLTKTKPFVFARIWLTMLTAALTPWAIASLIYWLFEDAPLAGVTFVLVSFAIVVYIMEVR